MHFGQGLTSYALATFKIGLILSEENRSSSQGSFLEDPATFGVVAFQNVAGEIVEGFAYIERFFFVTLKHHARGFTRLLFEEWVMLSVGPASG